METDDKYIQGLNQGLSYDMNNYPRLLHLNKNNPKNPEICKENWLIDR